MNKIKQFLTKIKCNDKFNQKTECYYNTYRIVKASIFYSVLCFCLFILLGYIGKDHFNEIFAVMINFNWGIILFYGLVVGLALGCFIWILETALIRQDCDYDEIYKKREVE